jgi:hypothetical protein
MNDRQQKITSRVGFYLTRLRRASLGELGYRLGQAGTGYRAGWLAHRGRIPCQIPSVSLPYVRSLSMPVFRGHVDRRDVDRILAGFRFNLNADPDVISRCEQEHQRCCPPVRSIAGQVDIRAIWEAGRLQHVTLLFAWLRQQPDDPDSERIKEFARDEILWWLTRNPFLYGPHYLSAMECGLRLPVFFYGLKSLDNLNRNDAEAILKGIFLHAWWIERNLSLFSSLGNHTVCEALGLVFAGGIFRETDAGRRWLKSGITLLEQELPHQVLADGGPAEQSFGYLRFVLDIFRLAVNFLENNNLRCCNDFKERLLLGEVFLSSFSYPGGNSPPVGDYDDGHAMAPGLSPRRPTTFEQRFRYRTFSQSGYTVVRGMGGSLLTFDHGPLGLAPLYGHGHADALSVTLTIGETPFLVDSGTYRYNGVPAFRRYFKGTRAHNTVTVDGLDQAVQLTGFVWGEPFSGQRERTVETETGLLVEASHDGYSKLDKPVRHTRSILTCSDGSWLITDHFQGGGQHSFELNFHLHPGVTLTEQAGGWLVERDGRGIRVELAQGVFHLRRGEEDPPLGWFSSGYNLKVPSPVLQAVQNGAPAEVRFETRITTLRALE